jgi:hypothetical protein
MRYSYRIIAESPLSVGTPQLNESVPADPPTDASIGESGALDLTALETSISAVRVSVV